MSLRGLSFSGVAVAPVSHINKDMLRALGGTLYLFE